MTLLAGNPKLKEFYEQRKFVDTVLNGDKIGIYYSESLFNNGTDHPMIKNESFRKGVERLLMKKLDVVDKFYFSPPDSLDDWTFVIYLKCLKTATTKQ